MDTKLTLSLNKSVIEKAKKYAKSKNISLSKMIESYLAAVTEKEEKEKQTTPLVESLIGVINLEADFDYKKGYGDYLVKKYQ
ncbi:DUF6364 family protein [Autumnicola edwardsiae]|uniref:DUF6364 family protein n=1 Tax=Autumnicola edwardsiae TaxID=3075594 RepID=A0ABU3CQY6_9FLAO|nr:DUF6364 family protein [Zunongwangia sp. F297]MDT0648772.1 DUF6364 family protein [Zunongwangia sp. F297]